MRMAANERNRFPSVFPAVKSALTKPRATFCLEILLQTNKVIARTSREVRIKVSHATLSQPLTHRHANKDFNYMPDIPGNTYRKSAEKSTTYTRLLHRGGEEFIFKGLVTKGRKENPRSTAYRYIDSLQVVIYGSWC